MPVSDLALPPTAPKSTQRGFTLLEMLVAMALFLIVTGAIYAVLKAGRANRFATNERSDILRNGRIVTNTIGRDILNAGFSYPRAGSVVPNGQLSTLLGIPADIDTTKDLLVSVNAASEINTNTLSPALNTDQITLVFRDTTFNSQNPLAVTSVVGTGGYYTVTLATGGSNPDNTGCTVGDVYNITSGSTSIIATLTAKSGTTQLIFATGGGDPLSLNPIFDTSNPLIIAPAAITRVRIISYRVLTDGSLVRTEYGNNGTTRSVDSILAYNIESLRFTYVLRDGTTVKDPQAGPDGKRGTSDDTPANSKQVAQIRMSIRVRSPERDAQTGQFFTVTLDTTFSTRNVGYDEG